MTTIIKSAYIPQAVLFMSREETRFYLCGLHICANPTGGARIVATDGHLLGIFRDAGGISDAPNIWPISKTLLAACKPQKADYGTRRWVVLGEGRAVVVLADTAQVAGEVAAANLPISVVHQEFIAPIDGTFPDYTRIVPIVHSVPEKGWAADHFDPAILERTMSPAYWTEDGDRRKEPLAAAVYSAAVGHPAIVKVSDRPDFVGVIMPRRVVGDHMLPAWWVSPPAAPSQVAPAADQVSL